MRAHCSSHTARLVARSLFLASRDPRLSRLLAPQVAEVLAMIPEVASGCFGKWVKRPWWRSLLFGIERIALPGVIAHYLARKLAIEGEVRNALASGAGRVVVIGAGFDTMAWRLHPEFPEVQWIEVDHPATQAIKIRSLGQALNLHHVPHDLLGSLPLTRRLEQTEGHGTPTVIIIEGVTMYLQQEKVFELLRDCALLAGHRGRVILTFMEMDEQGSFDFRGQNQWVRWWLKLRSEPFLWGIPQAGLNPFLHRCGLEGRALINHIQFRKRFLTPHGLGDIPLAEGEWVCVCHPVQPRA